MFELIYRVDSAAHAARIPKTSKAAWKRLEDGNRNFSRLTISPNDEIKTRHVITINANSLGISNQGAPVQKPFAAVLGCADARVPIELIFSQAANDLFVVRVAGNVLGAECLGSLDYAVTNLGESLRLLVVLGHTGCGAVSAAVQAFMEPHTYLDFAKSHPLRAVIERIMVGVRAAHRALEQVYSQDVELIPGYPDALRETAVVINAAMMAASLKNEFREKIGSQLDVAYGVYNLATRCVKLTLEKRDDVRVELAAPPDDGAGFDQLGLFIASSQMIRGLLKLPSE